MRLHVMRETRDMPGETSPEANKRSAQRLRVLKQGKILLPNNMTVIDCTVRDLSLTARGCCAPTPAPFPMSFRLVFTADRQMRDVKVVWRRPRDDRRSFHLGAAQGARSSSGKLNQ